MAGERMYDWWVFSRDGEDVQIQISHSPHPLTVDECRALFKDDGFDIRPLGDGWEVPKKGGRDADSRDV